MSASCEIPIERQRLGVRSALTDVVAVEEALEIRLSHPSLAGIQSLSMTMRTPGHDQDLVLGYLYCEGVIHDPDQVLGTRPCRGDARAIRVELTGPAPRLAHLQRVGIQSSSCGVCGKSSLAALSETAATRQVCGSGTIADAVLRTLPSQLRAAQAVFAQTGGLHGVGLFDLSGQLLAVREDVGRHNALDKLIGQAFLQKHLPWQEHVLLLSGRASYELLQKATMSGASIVAAVGAPSSLAVEQAQLAGITLIGFLNDRGYNMYSHAHRVC